MTTIQITCDNCGAKYKLPESFTSPKAKCQKCGSVIDVKAQREAAAAADEGAAAAPAAAASKPAAAAKPAVDRSKDKPAAAKAPTRAGRRAGGRRGRETDDGDEDAGTTRHGRHRRPAKKDNTPMIMGLVGLVAIIIVAVVLFMNQGDEPKADTKAQNDPRAAQPQEEPKEEPKEQPAEQPTDEPDEPTEQPKSDDPEEEEEKLPPGSPKWMALRKKYKTIADVDFEFPEVPWDKLPAEKREQLQNLAADYAAGGGAGRDAEAWMREHPYEAMFGLLDLLRSLDYKDSFSMMTTAYPLNRFMTELTYGLQTGFVPPGDMNAEMEPAQIQWNCITTRAWLQFFDIHPDETTFKKLNEERRKKQIAEGR